MNDETRDLNRAFPWLRSWIVWNDFDSSYGISKGLRDEILDSVGFVTPLEAKHFIQLVAINPPALTIGELAPLVPPKWAVENFDFTVRAYNCLKREGINSFRDLQPLTAEEIGEIRNLGGKTHTEVLENILTRNLELSEGKSLSAAEGSWYFLGEVSDYVSEESLDSDPESSPTKLYISALSTVADWIQVSGPVAPHELLALDTGQLDVLSRAALEQDMASIRGLLSSAKQLKSALFSKFEEASDLQKAVITQRICGEKSATLQLIADLHGVTRERARQIETSSRVEYEAVVSSSSQAQYLVRMIKKLSQSVLPVRLLREQFPEVSTYETLEGLSDIDIILGFEESIYIFESLASSLTEEELTQQLAKICISTPTMGLLSERSFREQIAPLGDIEALITYGMSKGLFELKHGSVYPSRVGLGDLAELVLGASGEPIDFNELSDLVLAKRSPKSLRNVLFGDERFVRTSLTDWALSSWGLEEYSNIRDEIEEALEEAGEIEVSKLAAELSEKFGVSASSVYSYASAWPFQIINGRVSKTSDSSVVYNRSLAESRNVFKVLGVPAIRLQYTSEHARGSGTTLSKAAAVILRLNHGDKREVQVSGTAFRLSLSHVRTHPTIGSIRAIAESLSAEVGDSLLFLIDEIASVARFEAGFELDVATVLSLFNEDASQRNEDVLLNIMREFLLLSESDTFPAVFAALRAREEFRIEGELREILGDNEAFNLRLNLRSESKFKIKSIK
jgi:hypothetical protein